MKKLVVYFDFELTTCILIMRRILGSLPFLGAELTDNFGYMPSIIGEIRWLFTLIKANSYDGVAPPQGIDDDHKVIILSAYLIFISMIVRSSVMLYLKTVLT